jgi:hypothetical protein
MLAFGAGCVAVSAALHRWIVRVEEASQEESDPSTPDQVSAARRARAMRSLDLVDQGLDEALREGSKITGTTISDHVRRGHEFDEEFGRGE